MTEPGEPVGEDPTAADAPGPEAPSRWFRRARPPHPPHPRRPRRHRRLLGVCHPLVRLQRRELQQVLASRAP